MIEMEVVCMRLYMQIKHCNMKFAEIEEILNT